jgi:hypothetical protein
MKGTDRSGKKITANVMNVKTAIQTGDVNAWRRLLALGPARANALIQWRNNKEKTVCSFLQLLGAACLAVVARTHICEALHLFSWMYGALSIALIKSPIPFTGSKARRFMGPWTSPKPTFLIHLASTNQNGGSEAVTTACIR